MATSNKRSQDDEETTDAAGRKHDGRGRFSSGEESEGGRGGQNGRSQGNEQAARGGQSGQGGASQKRVISRAVRVLNEIEARLHELREELEAQGGESGGGANGNGMGRGQVKHPETDGRLKQNRDNASNGTEEVEEDEEDEEETSGRSRSSSRR